MKLCGRTKDYKGESVFKMAFIIFLSSLPICSLYFPGQYHMAIYCTFRLHAHLLYTYTIKIIDIIDLCIDYKNFPAEAVGCLKETYVYL